MPKLAAETETKNFYCMHSMSNKIFASIIIAIVSITSSLGLSACASKRAKPGKPGKGPFPAIEDPVVNIEEIEFDEGASDDEDASKEWSDDLRLCLVLGPGMARGMAHVGVLEIIEKEKLPIHCIIGVEVGALVGVLYSMNRNLNKVQWQVFKIKKNVYLDYPLFSAIRSSKARTKKLRSVLKEYLGYTHLDDYQIPVAIGVTSLPGGSPEVLQNGPGVDTILASIALPEVFESQKIENTGEFLSGIASTPYPVRKAFELGATHVLVVDLLSDSFSSKGLEERDAAIWKQFLLAKNIGRYQLQNASYVLRPKLKNFRFTDFNRRVEIIEQGKLAMQELINRMRDDLSYREAL